MKKGHASNAGGRDEGRRRVNAWYDAVCHRQMNWRERDEEAEREQGDASLC